MGKSYEEIGSSLRSLIEAERISDACGFGVPLYAFQGERGQLVDWTECRSAEEVRA